MQRFATLYETLDATTSTRAKVDAIAAYLREAPPADAAWGVYFLAGGRPRRLVASRALREAACAAAGVPPWLFDECYEAVGDLAETIAHLLDAPASADPLGLDEWMTHRLLPLRTIPAARLPGALAHVWSALDARGRFVANKLITGALRVGVSRALVVRALAQAFGQDDKRVAQRMIGYTDDAKPPSAQRLLALACEDAGDDDDLRPFPFFLAHPLAGDPRALGGREDWIAEWKWDGIRAQLVRRADAVAIWSRGEELVTERFPELAQAAMRLAPGVVVDGEIVAWDAAGARPLSFARLQVRIARKRLTPKVLAEAPAVLVAYDLLEDGGEDLREHPLSERRARLERHLAAAGDERLRTSPLLDASDWDALARSRGEARMRGVEGLMLKRAASRYGVGRTKSHPAGDWWKWKVDPLSVDAVLVYAQAGHGRRASLYTDYTFAVWDAPPGAPQRRLVPFAKAYSGLTDDEMRRVDTVVRRTTVEKFGPVRSLAPTLVFELGFEAIQRSPRHKSGLAVRFPRMLRWRTEKPVDEADTLDTLRALLDAL